MKIVATFTIVPKRADQMIDLVRSLAAKIYLEAPIEIEVIPDEISIVHESTEAGDAGSALGTSDAGSASVASDGGDTHGSAGADTAGTAPAAVDAEGQTGVLTENVNRGTISTPMPEVAPGEASTESEVILEQVQRSSQPEAGLGDGQQQDGGDAIVGAVGSNADADSGVAGPAGEKPAE